MTNRASGAGAAVDQRGRDAGFAQQFGGAAHGVAFANRTKVEHHSRPRETNGAGGDIKLHEVHTHTGAGGGELRRVGQMAGAVYETPGAHERRNGNIKRTASFGAQAGGVFEEAESFGRDADGFGGGAGIDIGDLAGRTKEAELRFETVNFVERFFGGGAQAGGVIAGQDDFKTRGHRVAGEG